MDMYLEYNDEMKQKPRVRRRSVSAVEEFFSESDSDSSSTNDSSSNTGDTIYQNSMMSPVFDSKEPRAAPENIPVTTCYYDPTISKMSNNIPYCSSAINNRPYTPVSYVTSKATSSFYRPSQTRVSTDRSLSPQCLPMTTNNVIPLQSFNLPWMYSESSSNNISTLSSTNGNFATVLLLNT